MVYKLIITERADELLDKLLSYLIFHLKNEQAASHLIDNIEKIYGRLEENPYQFPASKDGYLRKMGYREAVASDMDYVIIFRIDGDMVYVVGIFHQLEDYRRKI